MPAEQLGFDVWLRRDLQARFQPADTLPPDLLALLEQFPVHQPVKD